MNIETARNDFAAIQRHLSQEMRCKSCF